MPVGTGKQSLEGEIRDSLLCLLVASARISSGSHQVVHAHLMMISDIL